jgi:hypothetical protein
MNTNTTGSTVCDPAPPPRRARLDAHAGQLSASTRSREPRADSTRGDNASVCGSDVEARTARAPTCDKCRRCSTQDRRRQRHGIIAGSKRRRSRGGGRKVRDPRRATALGNLPIYTRIESSKGGQSGFFPQRGNFDEGA